MRTVIYIILTLLTALPVLAAENGLDVQADFGRKGSSGQVVEEDLTDEFNYHKYSAKYSRKMDKMSSFWVKYTFYQKDFDTLENLDNDFNAFSAAADTPLYFQDDYLIKVHPDIDLKEKTYRDAKNLDYDQVRFDIPVTFKKEDDWSVRLSGGMNSYHYENAPKDQLKINGKMEVAKKFFDRALDVSAFYRYQYIMRQKIANRQEGIMGAEANFKLDDWPVIKSAGAGFDYGKDNTIIFEDREDSFDYKYAGRFLKASYLLFEKLKGTFKFSYLDKIYADFNHNYDGWIIDNNWSLKVYEAGDLSAELKMNYLHKQFRFPYAANPFSLYHDWFGPDIEIRSKDDWRLATGGEFRFYTFPARRTNDKIYYIYKLSLEKKFLKKDLTVGFDYKYTFKNFLHKLDITEDAFTFKANYKF